MDIAELGQTFCRKLGLLALDFLKAQDIRALFGQHPHDLIDAQANRIDVPGGDADHGSAFRLPDRASQGARWCSTRAAGMKKPSSRGHWDEGSFSSVRHANSRHRNEGLRSEEHTSELQSLIRTSYADFCLK